MFTFLKKRNMQKKNVSTNFKKIRQDNTNKTSQSELFNTYSKRNRKKKCKLCFIGRDRKRLDIIHQKLFKLS